jgi:hypothetical protein
MSLSPMPGFNWSQVGWGAPDQVRTLQCSYCDEPLDDEEMPLILWRGDGWCAEFCEACQRKWWGLEAPDAPTSP